MSKSLRPLSVLTRPSNCFRPLTRSQHSFLRRNGDIKIQEVRFKRDLPRRAKQFFYHLALSSAVVYYCVPRNMTVEEEETVDNSSAPSKTQLEIRSNANNEVQDVKIDEDDVQVPETIPADAFFIPLGRIRQVPQTYYKHSDPEWQSFAEFGQDRKRRVAVQKELAEIVHSAFAGTKDIQQYTGVPIILRRIWLDIIIPSVPPPEYERSGLEITDNYIAWTTRPVSTLQVARLNSALKPLPVAKSLWASCSTYGTAQLARLKQLFNIAPTSSSTSPHLPAGAIPVDQLRANSPQKETQNRAQMNKMSDPKSDTKSDVGSSKGSAKPASSDGSKMYGSLPSLPQPDSDIDSAIMEFRRTLAMNWQPPRDKHIGRGTCAVRGDVELTGPNGSFVLGVFAEYHPREANYTHVTADLKYFVPRRHEPRPDPKNSNP